MILIIAIILILIIITSICMYNKESFSELTSSGYGFNHEKKCNIFVPFNNIDLMTDFKLLSLTQQLKYNILKPPNNLIYTNTEEGVLGRTPLAYTNIILIPGLGDCLLYQNGTEVWPNNSKNLKLSQYTEVLPNENGHFSTILNLLESMNYRLGYKLNILPYNFINIDINQITKQLQSYLIDNTVIIAYDFGCVIANTCVQQLSLSQKNKINKLLYVCPTIGGSVTAIKNYLTLDTKDIIKDSEGLLLSFPTDVFYNHSVLKYNNIDYYSDQISNLFKINKIDTSFMFNNPNINTIIVGCKGIQTITKLNYKNNLKSEPKSYLPYLDNSGPELSKIQGETNDGDGIIPIENIYKLHHLWNSNSILEIINNKDHYNILKSYELGIIISSLI